jgi:muramidase (phage lysozyme)/peptidoglycan hydrolase-like protein with peptidoglycan-binding domain
MDKSVPRGAAILLDFIGNIEAPKGYDTIYGNNQGKLPKPLTTMNLGDVIDAQKSWTRRFKSSASGRYQFMRATLMDLSKELHLSGTQVFDADFQDRLGYHLLKRRGYEAFVAGKMSRTEFGKRLAQEWASLPVLQACDGAKRKITRGMSYYEGDALNKSLIKPDKVEAVLNQVRGLADEPAPAEKPEAKPGPPTRATDSITIEVVQSRLWELGYTEVGSRDPKTGRFDGHLGKMTKAAILAFRNENGLPVSDAINQQLLDALDTAKPRTLPRNDAPADKVREAAPEVRTNWLIKIGAVAAGIPAAVGGLFDGVLGNLSTAGGYVNQIRSYADGVPGWVWSIGLVVIAAGVYLVARHGEKKGVEAFREGARRS